MDIFMKKFEILLNKNDTFIEKLDGYDIKNIGNIIFQDVYNIIKSFEKDNKELISLTLEDLNQSFKLNYFNVQNKDFTKVMGVAKASGLLLSTITNFGIPVYKYLNNSNLEKLYTKIVDEHIDILKSYTVNNGDKWDNVVSDIIKEIKTKFPINKKIKFKY